MTTHNYSHATATATDTTSTKPKHRDLYDWLDLGIKAIGITLAIVAAFHAANTFERDVNEKLVDQRIKFANDALLAAGQIQIASDWKTYEHAEDVFGIIKHGPGIALFGNTDTIYKALEHYFVFCDNLRGAEGDDYDATDVYDAIEPEFEKLSTVLHENLFRPNAHP